VGYRKNTLPPVSILRNKKYLASVSVKQRYLMFWAAFGKLGLVVNIKK